MRDVEDLSHIEVMFVELFFQNGLINRNSRRRFGVPIRGNRVR